jgi:demethylmenaquinone methyltransferase/2-methoxy-6-polyprenyl-1,4-benzoquinol methylase
MNDSLQTILDDQKRYYRARAGEYDQWFYRQGRYDYGPEHTHQWQSEAEMVRQRLARCNLTGHVVEFAAGTGIWTQELLKTAARITALDSSPEVIEINRAKLQSDKVTYTLADIFAWRPSTQYDAAFMGFWLSHVPPTKLDSFLTMVSRALKPGGKLFLVDSLPTPSGTAKDQVSDLVERQQQNVDVTLTRRLNDGRTFQIVKIFYDPGQLAEMLRSRGIETTVTQTDNFFLYGWGTKSPPTP